MVARIDIDGLSTWTETRGSGGRRSHAGALQAPRPRDRGRRLFLGAPVLAAGVLRGQPAPQGPRHLGNARRVALFHARPGDDVGGVRPGRTRGPDLWPAGSGRAVGTITGQFAPRSGKRLNAELQSFTQNYDKHEVDASLCSAQTGFVHMTSEDGRTVATDRSSCRQARLRYRYRTPRAIRLSGESTPFVCALSLARQYANRAESRARVYGHVVPSGHRWLLSEESTLEAPAGRDLSAGVHTGPVRAADALQNADIPVRSG